MNLFNNYTETKPKLSELQCTLLSDPKTCSKWEFVGIELKLADNDDGIFLEEVADQFPDDDKKRLLQVFKKWLRTPDLAASWGHLFLTLCSLNLNNAVRKLKEHLGKLLEHVNF